MTLLLKYFICNHFGILTCMNLFCLDFVCLILDSIPTYLKDPKNYSHYTGECLFSTRTTTWTRGIFCMNICHSLKRFNPFQGTWCGSFCTLSSRINFFRQMILTVTQTIPRFYINGINLKRRNWISTLHEMETTFSLLSNVICA